MQIDNQIVKIFVINDYDSVTLYHNEQLFLLHLKNQYFYLSRVSNFTKSYFNKTTGCAI